MLNNAGGKEQVLAIAGSNVRGTIFGVYDFEQKHLGVDPFWFWADHEPPTRGELIFDESINFGPTQGADLEVPRLDAQRSSAVHGVDAERAGPAHALQPLHVRHPSRGVRAALARRRCG